MLFVAALLLASRSGGTEPRIAHAPLERAPRGTAVVIEATIADPEGIFQALVFARPAGQGRFSSYPMEERGDDRYSAELPGSILSKGSFEYFVQADDNAGNTASSGSQQKPFRVTGFDPPPKPTRISVRSEPAGAQLFIDGAPEGEAPQVVQLTPGKHTVAATMAGRRSVEHMLDLIPGRDLDLLIALAEGGGPGSLSIVSDPPGAKVLLDGERIGTAPLKRTASAGMHRVTLELEGRVRPERDVEIREGRDVELSFALPELPRDPALSVETEPSGAALAIDGKDRGRSPWIGPLAAGPHTVVVRMEGRREVETSFQMPKGRDLSLRLPLPPAKIDPAPHLTVSTSPYGASILVDGMEVGLSPWTGALEAGERFLTVQLAGFQTQGRKVALSKGRDAEVSFALAREPGPAHLRVETEPAGAAVSVDGKAWGTAPLTGDLAPGEHQLEAVKAGFRAVAQQIAVEPGQSLSLRLALAPAAASKASLVQVVTQPRGARVLLDTAAIGETPVKSPITAGPHTLRMELEGYQPRFSKFNFPGDREVDLVLAVSLKPLREGSTLEAPDALALARAQLKRAQACHNQGDYACALAGYKAAYEFKPLPELLFNIAQARRRKGDFREAAEAYRAFLKAAPGSPLTGEAQRLLQSSEQLALDKEAPRPDEDRTPPRIAHQAVVRAIRGQPLRVIATIQDDRSGVFAPQACFRTLDSPEYECAPMVLVGADQYGAEIPARAVADGLAYFVEAFDNAGNGPSRSGAPELPHAVAMQEKAPPPGGPIIVDWNSSMTPPEMLSGKGLKYTREAMEHRVEGQMAVKCVITVAGTVKSCRVLKGLPYMDQAVVEALQSRKYRPAVAQGKPVDVEYTFNISLGLP